ncbi:hypothetical protein BD408DRAFT_441318 [Parasitella parasitica]|nr:hypothetical protein BD408DRAFT_441318 [Parasitella parasitica]
MLIALFFVLYSIFNETLDQAAKIHVRSDSQRANNSQKELDINEVVQLRMTLNKLIDDHKQLSEKVDEISKRMAKPHAIDGRPSKTHTSKVKRLIKNIEQTIDHVDISKLGSNVCVGDEDLSTTSNKISESTANNGADRIRALEQDVQYLLSRVESLSDKKVSPSELLTKMDLKNQMKRCAEIDAANQELKEAIAGFSSAIKEQELQTKRLAYKVTKRIPTFYL